VGEVAIVILPHITEEKVTPRVAASPPAIKDSEGIKNGVRTSKDTRVSGDAAVKEVFPEAPEEKLKDRMSVTFCATLEGEEGQLTRPKIEEHS